MWNSPVLLSRFSKVLFGLAVSLYILAFAVTINGLREAGYFYALADGVLLMYVVFRQLSTLTAANEALRLEIKNMQAKIDKIELRLP